MNIRILAACIVTICIIQPAYSAEDDDRVSADSIDEVISEMREEVDAIPPATSDISRQIDDVVGSVISTMEFASDAMKKGNLPIVVDSLGMIKGSLSIAMTKFPNNLAKPNDELVSALEGKGFTKVDVGNVKALMGNMAEIEKASLPDLSGLMDRVQQNGMDIARLNQSLENIESSAESVVQQIQMDAFNLANFSQSLQSILNSTSNIGNISREIGVAVANLGGSLQQAANAVAASIAAGVSVNLDAAAQGYGYGSFASAVDAYNAEHGTCYTVESAKGALGQ
jgi:hypothetical protein